ncbi:MAG: 1,2-phenylacetyl-CoA epoxidase subunit A [Ignavibacteriaceae bacterium]|jgi:phenylacetate-CoA oxygenase, PaaG subunit|nr:MAG: 1,2-phenylacetyl-CoA epoxidase subunit A [Chlorobiota bacterium]KXK06054.1 MAG: 1,2-phenylacetyl-CoA epoxidase, subunit A [Chlorobi bacterium OLB4]MBV6398489.1 1,2-phenylacetyl-CoA epoxidase, subunit A [Ignavibacteria bacterium]MCC6885723.1 1,2-phenylacetyl-CoA epoxidase subunit A [Ignavibacteriales bacterium]MCE7953082.1 1,2-phenylacetyl-CoA epoxidase subunit A [Chlorobi bacterium CHB7]MDL1887080.1 1,2-phenylacetyl-CoA epoxidase subunit A [Ignavibacteria bacterium CHB1]MEB2329135.1 1
MYGGGYIFEENGSGEIEDSVKLKEFETRISAGDKVEPTDWMPVEYRKQLIRMIEQHAHSEIIGALPEGTWITRAPGFRRKLALMAKVQDEVGHAQLLYSAAETLGKPREMMINDLINGKSKYSNVFNYPAETWADTAIIAWLIDAGAIINQVANSKGSYGPYCRALERICQEESFHLKYGHDNVVFLATGTRTQREMVQGALNRWWKPIMHFFGPSDKISVHTETMMKWKLKMASNDEMRQKFLDMYVPKIRDLGLTIPDPALRKNEQTCKWEYTEPDWEEFKRVINGDGPCNKERLAVRKKAEEKGAWVRRALLRNSEQYVVPLS